MLTPPSLHRFPTHVLVAVVAVVMALLATTLATTLGTPAQASTDASGHVSATLGPAAKQHERRFVSAKDALTRAQNSLSATTPASERPDATMALRDLWLLKDALSPADRAAAERLERRPRKPAVLGNANILVHYDPAEVVGGYTPQQALDTLAHVSDTYVSSGYRRPKSDGTKGGDGRIDIYLDTLEPGLYGYCTTDEKKRRTTKPGHSDVWAFCVLDNDYARFPAHTPLENLQVTAAHEYFHAVQFSYDIAEDGWFLEATATWAEDELFTAVNDNVQFLEDSPITHPGQPLDQSGTLFDYGVWIYFRYLTERYPARTGALSGLLLRMWEYADSSTTSRKDLYSIQAIDKALRKTARTSLAKTFTTFSAATRVPALFSEGVANDYPAKRLGGRASLKPGGEKTFYAKLDHTTSRTYRFVPRGRRTSKLKLWFLMPPQSRGSRAVAQVVRTNGAIELVEVRINRRGIAKKKVAFDSTVAAVEVTLVNASTRYRDCYREFTAYSCSGDPVDDDSPTRLRAKAS